MTTVLDSIPNPALERWKKRVGTADAHRIAARSAVNGTRLHSFVEQYLSVSGGEPHPRGTNLLFKPLLGHLSKITTVHLIEKPVWSDKLELAGTPDAVVIYDNALAVLDFKTALREKKREWINHYFAQGFAYAYMLWERCGIDCKKVVILIATETGVAQEFIEMINPWTFPKYLDMIYSAKKHWEDQKKQ